MASSLFIDSSNFRRSISIIEHTLTQSEYENLDSVPFVLVEGIPGEIHVPVFAHLRLNITSAYAGNTTISIRWAVGQAVIATFGTPDLSLTGFTNLLMGIVGAIYKDSDHNPVGSDVILTGNAHVVGGTIASITIKVGYSILGGY